MRYIYFLFLIAFTGGAVVLAYENQHSVALTIFGSEMTTSVPILVGLSYIAGMLSGWTVVGMLRRSVNRVLDREHV